MHTPSRAQIAFILAALSAIGPFAIDSYLPALPTIARSLKTSDIEAQQTLTAYLAAFTVMTLWHGALADAFGRRWIILGSLIVFAAASFGSIFVTSIEQLWLLRALQGMSAGAGTVVGRALVRDLYEGVEAQRLMARIAIMFALAPSIAPVIGGWLYSLFGWRSIFVFLTSFIVLLFALCFFYLPETLPPDKRQPFHPRSLLQGYVRILTHPQFLLASMAIGLCFAGFFVYVLSAPKFLLEHLHVSERGFLWLFGPAMLGMVCGSTLAGRTAGKLSLHRTLIYALVIMAAAAVFNLAFSCLFAPSLPWSVVPLFFYSTGLALAMPTLTLIALDYFPERRGMAASCQSFVQIGLNSLLAGVIAPRVWGSTVDLSLSMGVIFLLGAVMALACMYGRRER